MLQEVVRLAAIRDSGFTRAIFSYPAKFQAHVPADLIRRHSAPGELVLDPFAGGGTTGLEAMLLGRPSVMCDLNPLGALTARVKTTRLDGPVAPLEGHPTSAILDPEDTACLGARISDEIERFAAGAAAAPPAPRDLLRLALVATVRYAGRRDFDADSIRELYAAKVARVAAAAARLPAAAPPPRVVCGSNHELPVETGAARLVITSPPYKDLDVEYALIQLQRPALGRSRRSRLVWKMLDAPILTKRTLCGGVGETYWKNLAPSLAELRRALAPGAPAFFWIGFKRVADRRRFEAALVTAGLAIDQRRRARLGHDRVASSRSGASKLLARDWLIACA
jgi:hypothetical protein